MNDVNQGLKALEIDRQKRVWESLVYSHQKLDTLLISICGGGVYVCLETVKFQIQNKLEVHCLVKVSAITFLIAIISNFISQFISSRIHLLDYNILQIYLTCSEDTQRRISDYEEDISKYEKKIYSNTKWNYWMTFIAISSMSVGLITIVCFFLFIF